MIDRETAAQWVRDVGLDEMPPGRYTCNIVQIRALIARAQYTILEAAAQAVQARYMGDNNREDMEVLKCAEVIRKLKEWV